ncbi:MAG: hypothetical protein OEY31_01700 [Candidatus Bathyarchaeota archaeon]|nr:hypothetical protein [Candidatus Bathyarchaeota archaeon]
MAGLRFQVKEELEKRFREAAMRRFGYRKGSLSRAAEEAIHQWLISVSAKGLVFEGDPVEALDGLLADVDLDSVELQHLAMKKWAGEVLADVSP